MSELMAQYEQFSLLDKELDVQAAMLEKLVDRVACLEADVLQLERMKGRAPRKDKKDVVPPTRLEV